MLPILILVVIAIPSFRLVYYEDRTPDADLTVKVTGHQWYWEYAYPDKGNIDFSSYIVPDDQLKPGQLRLLTVDNDLVVPAGKNIRVLTTSSDVIHSFFVPRSACSATPSRAARSRPGCRADKPGIYYGECNQICGTNHSRMPIVVRAVTPQEFEAWLVQAKSKFSDAGSKATAAAAPSPALAAPDGATSADVTQASTTPAGATRIDVASAKLALGGLAGTSRSAWRRRHRFSAEAASSARRRDGRCRPQPTTTPTPTHDHKPGFLLRWLCSTNHKDIGTLYI